MPYRRDSNDARPVIALAFGHSKNLSIYSDTICTAYFDLQTTDDPNSLLINGTMKGNLGLVVRTKMWSETKRKGRRC